MNLKEDMEGCIDIDLFSGLWLLIEGDKAVDVLIGESEYSGYKVLEGGFYISKELWER